VVDSRDSTEVVRGARTRRPWSAPAIITSEFAKYFQKLDGGVGYEYHETDNLGGGTTNVS
jgi:hypothetical protein